MKMQRLLLLALLATTAACSTEELCDPGTAGCPCLSDATCRLDSLICLADICVDPGSLCDGDSCAPSVPKCFSPCIQDVVRDDGKVLACSDEGLLEGCLGDTECVQGSCIPTISSRVSALVAPGTCAEETDCPDYQTCIQGRCFSNCGDGSECPDTRDCHRHVCRVRCTDAAPCKEEGYACDLSGVCLPLVTPSAPATSVLQGDFRVSVDRVRFSSDAPQAELELVNDSGTVAQFLVKKVEQRVLLDGGTADVRLASEGDAPCLG
ncbi:MAG: hypothetical protein H6730_21520 [Deltaproteobacteria bacterium]|nr:hypothetical protein [Deltaproteobacteria bacterium]